MSHRAPLFEALAAHSRMGSRAFHVPGHKQRAGFSHEEAAAYYDSMASLDVTELPDTDDLHHPVGCLLEAQQLAAACYGADETRFLVGGSTAGNLSMILGVCEPGDLVIVQRNVHKSIIHGLMLAGAQAVLLSPELDPISGLGLLPHPERLKRALERYPEARGVIVTNPNYYGMTGDLAPLVRLVHERSIPVLVDEAHGPHFGFHPSFPIPALRSGADVVVHSAHKMLSAMTMGAMIHMQGDLLDREPIRQALRMVQSSSPSFPILASLDLARCQLQEEGAHAFSQALLAIDTVMGKLAETPFRRLGTGEYHNAAVTYDPLKLVLFDETETLDGFTLRDELGRRGCIAEMADSRYVVLAFGTGSIPEDGAALIQALFDIADSFHLTTVTVRGWIGGSEKQPLYEEIPAPVVFRRTMPPSESIPLEESAGRIAAEWVIPYPPGIPVLFPGEVIQPSAVNELLQWRIKGSQIQGAEDPSLCRVRVLEKRGFA